MALVTCKDCGNPVSDQAKTCIKCGAPVPEPKKKTGVVAWTVCAFIAVGIVSSLFAKHDPAVPVAGPASAAPIVLTAAQTAAKDQESETRGLALLGARALKAGSKDPKTFEFEKIVAHPNWTVCYEYRAKNSFNAVLAGEAVLVKNKMLVHERDGNSFVRAWNKSCTPADGTDVLALVTRAME
jgi:zinc-ribbon domain